jgi:hypothetical protein
VFHEARRLYRGGMIPLAALTIGLWLVLTPARRWARDRDLSVAKMFRCLAARPALLNPGAGG